MNRQLFLSLTSFFGLLCEVTVVAQPAPDYATKALSGDVVGGESLAGVSVFVPARILETGRVFFTADLDNGEQAFMNDQEIAIVTGAQVVGAAIGTEISFLGRAAVNDVGEIVMSVLLDGAAVDVTNNSALVNYNGTVNMIVQKGDPLTGTSENAGDILSTRILPTTTGDSHPGAYSTTIVEPSGNSAILSLPGNGSPVVVEAVGDMVSDETVEQLSSPTTNNSRRVALYLRKWPGTVPQTDHAQAVLYQNDGSKFVLLETGDSGYGLPAGTTIKDLFVPKTNDQDDLTVFTEYQGFVSGESIHQFQIDGTSVTSGRSVAQTGEPAPGVPGQGFSFFQNFVVNQTGDVAFQAIVDALVSPGTATTMGPDEGTAPIVGIWCEDPTGTLQLAAHDGLQAPGLDAGVTLEQVGFPAFNALN